ncbi:hypothetical protein QE361_000694 [Sphingomonas sp. SORGH_AS802]|jgi:hypothetical protein|uniref:DUF4230 domain-containing protein n=1 Tax=unclassified Sphingomonas TaxID=196159 RepID=UPI002861DDAC|nr:MULTISPECIES: DUF4230 domain-containing protein [unclassified Sphingomonas]MDR6127347.1 hypothetical protein [Sphingomonas sp. SORGH_AS_0438]MDR6133736.1 hypothetical protein [Sphingomonas sp. SORGH_AS_0802]
MADRGVEAERTTGAAVAPARGGGIGAFLAKTAGVLVLLVLAVLIALWGVQRYVTERLTPDPVTVASASLQGLREQNRLSAFAARYVAVVTSTQSQLGFQTQKTLIMPGTVRYEVDLAKLTQRDVAWNPETHTLSVRLPPVEVDGPQVDLNATREYGSGGVLSTFTNAEAQLDAANRRAGQAELLRQAREPTAMALARDASRRAVERSFTMPLRAVGVDAKVVVRFADEPVANDERWDVSRSIDEVLANRR